MALSSATVTYNLDDLLGQDLVPNSATFGVRTNIPGETIVDTVGNVIRLGPAGGKIASSVGSVAVWTPGTGSNPATWQTYFDVTYQAFVTQPGGGYARQRLTRTFGPFTITGNADLADLVAEQEVPPNYAAGLLAEMQDLRDQVQDISQIAVPDDVITAIDANPASDFRQQQDARQSASFAPTLGAPVRYLDGYTNFFGGHGWVAGQATAPTTTTAAVSAGATVIPVTSAAGISTGMLLVTAAGTANQQIHAVTSVAGNNVTVGIPLTSGLANGASVAPLFTNENHLTDAGYSAWARFILAFSVDGQPIFSDMTGKRITLLWNSWGAQGGDEFTAGAASVFPGAAVTVLGYPGEFSAQILTHFGSVPTDSDYVIFNEPGVNDALNGTVPAVAAANLAALIAAIRDIGATPIYTGPIPMSNAPTRAVEQRNVVRGVLEAPAFFPYLTADGVAALTIPTRKLNASSYGLGFNALQNLTTGDSNVALGQAAGFACTAGSESLFLGTSAGQSVTTGSSHVLIGLYAGFAPGGLSANAITTGNSCVFLGAQSGYPDATQATGAVAIGYNALAGGGNCAVAIGYATKAAGNGAVAIGADHTATGAQATADDDFVLGTALHKVKVLGRLNVARRTPTGSADAQGAVGDITSDDSYLYAKTSTGWKRAALTTF